MILITATCLLLITTFVHPSGGVVLLRSLQLQLHPAAFFSAACLGRPWAPGPGGSTSGGLAVGRAAGAPGQLGGEPSRPRRCQLVVIIVGRVLPSSDLWGCGSGWSMEALVG